MEIRMWEYDTQIALLNAEYREGVLYVDFPDSAVIYLRSNPNTPDELKICIRAARKELKYGIPILKVKNYTLEDIFERRLWMLIPFYIFRYEKELSQIDSDEDRLKKLRKEYERVAEMLDQECKNGRMRSVTGGALCELSRTVVEKLASKYENVEKEVAEVMGGKVLTYRSKELYQEALAKGIEQGLANLAAGKYQRGESIEKIADDLLMSTVEVEELLNNQEEADDDSFRMGSLEIAALLGHWKWF